MTFRDIILHLQNSFSGKCSTHLDGQNLKSSTSSDKVDSNLEEAPKQNQFMTKRREPAAGTEHASRYEAVSHVIISIDGIKSSKDFSCCTVKCGDFKMQAHPTFFKGLYVPVPDPENSTLIIKFQEKMGCEKACYIPASELKKKKSPLELALTDTSDCSDSLLVAESKKKFVDSIKTAKESYRGSDDSVDIDMVLIDFDAKFQGVFKTETGNLVYIADASEMIDVRIAEILNENRHLMEHVSIKRISKGRYKIADRPVQVMLGYEFKCDKPLVMVYDGPLKQPFLQYVQKSDQLMEFEPVHSGNKVFTLPTHQRLSWKANNTLDRIQAMKFATNEAKARNEMAKRHTAPCRRSSSSMETISTATSPNTPLNTYYGYNMQPQQRPIQLQNAVYSNAYSCNFPPTHHYRRPY